MSMLESSSTGAYQSVLSIAWLLLLSRQLDRQDVGVHLNKSTTRFCPRHVQVCMEPEESYLNLRNGIVLKDKEDRANDVNSSLTKEKASSRGEHWADNTAIDFAHGRLSCDEEKKNTFALVINCNAVPGSMAVDILADFDEDILSQSTVSFLLSDFKYVVEQLVQIRSSETLLMDIELASIDSRRAMVQINRP